MNSFFSLKGLVATVISGVFVIWFGMVSQILFDLNSTAASLRNDVKWLTDAAKSNKNFTWDNGLEFQSHIDNNEYNIQILGEKVGTIDHRVTVLEAKIEVNHGK